MRGVWKRHLVLAPEQQQDTGAPTACWAEEVREARRMREAASPQTMYFAFIDSMSSLRSKQAARRIKRMHRLTGGKA